MQDSVKPADSPELQSAVELTPIAEVVKMSHNCLGFLYVMHGFLNEHKHNQ